MKINPDKKYTFSPSSYFKIPSPPITNSNPTDLCKSNLHQKKIIKSLPVATKTEQSASPSEKTQLAANSNLSPSRLALHNVTKKHLQIRRQVIALKQQYGEDHILFQRAKQAEKINYQIIRRLQDHSTKSQNNHINNTDHEQTVKPNSSIPNAINQSSHQSNHIDHHAITKVNPNYLPVAATSASYCQLQDQFNSQDRQQNSSTNKSSQTPHYVTQIAVNAYRQTIKLKNNVINQFKGFFCNFRA
ncbi:MAG TPA: hypothetical protein PLH65_01210 [bacterium]|nr:hypothetical protein [bacterium]